MSNEQSTTTVLEEVQTGSIAIVWNGVFSTVQFNCSCLDALHLCKGMCCTSRVGFSVELDEDELGLYRFRYKKTHNPFVTIPVLATKDDGSGCVYFNQVEGLCSIHEHRPKMCRQWHCSPKGEMGDTKIERRDAGWQLLPIRKEEADFVQLRRDNG